MRLKKQRIYRYRTRLASFTVVAGLLGACAATPYPEAVPQPTDGQFSGQVVPSIPPFASSGHNAFDAWRDDFSKRALKDGRNPAVVYDVLRDLKPLEIYLPKNPVVDTANKSAVSEQAEFAKPVWEYLRTAVSDTRIINGADQLNQNLPAFDQISAAYGVDKTVVAAIWGMETNYGSFIGNFDGPETLANMAVEGRRRGLAERELLATMKIIEQGLARRDQLVAGWAGAMGQTQFMPSTYLAYGVDHSGDGNLDVWNTRADALASAANYLSVSGYVPDDPWGIEVRAPSGFDYALADGSKRSAEGWRALGLDPMTGGDLATLSGGPDRQARLWLPAGATGPKYLLYKNFDVFLTYNRSNSYALAVGLLADAIGGKSGPVASWPKDMPTLSKAQVRELQSGLNSLGFNAGAVDGVAGSGTRAALQRFQKTRSLVADGYPNRAALNDVLAAVVTN
jgi:lytic murein transglycosylase